MRGVATLPKLEGTPEERSIAAWELFISAGQRFTCSHWTVRANLGNRSTQGGRWAIVFDAVEGAIAQMAQENWHPEQMASHRGVVAEAVAKMPPRFTVARNPRGKSATALPKSKVPSVLEQLRAEAESLGSAIAVATEEFQRACAILAELEPRKKGIDTAIAALEGGHV